ncbi:MAG: hypothetical protein DRP02_14145 [Candidatus Gerdarchaeota archaeon]|nr:MAG: hypothetical protein DRP02_14145 [Candidatus Gerdarchaeota archaeon]
MIHTFSIAKNFQPHIEIYITIYRLLALFSFWIRTLLEDKQIGGAPRDSDKNSEKEITSNASLLMRE